WDPQGSRLFVVGGRVPCSTTVFDDAFVLQNAGGASGVGPYWGPLGDGASPALLARAGSKGAYDTLFDRFLSFGGLEADGTTPSPSVFLIMDTKGSNAGWTELPVPATAPRPSARAFHSLVYDQAAHRGAVFGGDSGGELHNDVWLLELEISLAKVTGIDPDRNEPGTKRGTLRFSASPSPNPASHGVEFAIHASQSVPAEVRVYDALGRRVATLWKGPLTEGEHRFNWKGNVASGIYFVAVQSGSDREIRRVVIAH
ncbi:MAG TPA: T9SS type A sorting domain-containing protein, partial [Candidatus Eisenbacteria bacterium]|nr:T9SS type A sorting domain-containing protein [Candidatus Eisenbacteria bacterium]